MSSDIWNYFTVDKDNKTVVCKLENCKTKYTYSKANGTSCYIRHLKKCHEIDLNLLQKKSIKKNTMSETQQATINDNLLQWIICDSHSFNVVSNPYLIKLFDSLNSDYKLPNRKQIAKNIEDLYEIK